MNDVTFAITRRNGIRVRDELEPCFSFSGLVVERKEIVKTEDKNGYLVDNHFLVISLEVADKEQIPEMVELVRSFETAKAS